MIAKLCLIFLFVVMTVFGLAGSSGAQSDAETATAGIVYLGQKGDPYYEPDLAYTGLSLKDLDRPVIGAEMAVRSARVLSRSLGLKFTLDVVLIEPGASALDAVKEAFASEAVAVLLDLPEPAFEEVVASKLESKLFINIRHRDDKWRGVGCAPNLLHTIPSYGAYSGVIRPPIPEHPATPVTCCCEAIRNRLPSAFLARRKPDEEIVYAEDTRRFTAVSGGSVDPTDCGEPGDRALHPSGVSGSRSGR